MNATVTELLAGPWAQRVGWALIHFLWQGLVVALLLAVALHLLRRGSPHVRWAASCAALGLMALLPVLTASLVHVGASQPEASLEVAVEEALPPAALGTRSIEPLELAFPVAPAESGGTVQPEPAPALPWHARVAAAIGPALPWVVLAWLLGVAGLSVWHVGGWWQLERWKRRGTSPVPDAVADLFGRLARRLAVSRPVRVLESARVAVPVVVGWVRPLILLPASALSGLTTEQLEAILAHELAHVRRHDCLVRAAQAVVETLLFYHPAVWWVSGRIRQESEECCDELAVQVCGDRRTYARALARAADVGRRARRATVAADGGQLLERIRRIVGLREPKEAIPSRWLAGVLAATVVVALATGPYISALAFPPGERPAAEPTDVPTAEPAEEREAGSAAATEQVGAGPGVAEAGAFGPAIERGPHTAEEVLARMAERRQPIRMAIYEFRTQQHYVQPTYRDIETPQGTVVTDQIVVPAGTRTLAAEKFIVAGAKYRWEVQGLMLNTLGDSAAWGLLPHRSIRVYDGVRLWEQSEESWGEDKGAMHAIESTGPQPRVWLDLRPLMLFHYGVQAGPDPAVSEFVLEGKEEWKGHSCYVLAETGGGTHISYYVDPLQGWAIVRATSRNRLPDGARVAGGVGQYGLVNVETEVDYRQDDSGLWRPAGWVQRVWDVVGAVRKPRYVFTSVVERAVLNEEVPDATFRLTWPMAARCTTGIETSGTPMTEPSKTKAVPPSMTCETRRGSITPPTPGPTQRLPPHSPSAR